MEMIKALFFKPPAVRSSLLSQSTVLVTGSTAGIGLEVAREAILSHPKRLILAVRDMEKGERIAEELRKGTSTEIDVKKLDQGSLKSVRTFVESLGGDRIDVAVLNAGVMNTEYISTADGYESDLQVNFISPALLSVLLIPNLQLAADSRDIAPHLCFVASGLYSTAKFPERKLPAGQVIKTLNDPAKYKNLDRYPTTKALGMLWARELAARTAQSGIVINSVNPGFCKKTGLFQNNSGIMALIIQSSGFLFGRTPRDGARCILDSAFLQGKETSGKYLSENSIQQEVGILHGQEGSDLQKKMWSEVINILKDKGETSGFPSSILA